jgi:hypothetical protein
MEKLAKITSKRGIERFTSESRLPLEFTRFEMLSGRNAGSESFRAFDLLWDENYDELDTGLFTAADALSSCVAQDFQRDTGFCV